MGCEVKNSIVYIHPILYSEPADLICMMAYFCREIQIAIVIILENFHENSKFPGNFIYIAKKDDPKPYLNIDTVNVTCGHERKKCNNSQKYRDILIVKPFAISLLFPENFVLSR